MISTIKFASAAAAVVAVITVGVSGANRSARRAGDSPRVMVLAELFTSEGCSSCPPADALLRQLSSTQPVDGVEIVALSNHVDYWNHLGWRDPFSLPLFSARQDAYDSAVFRSGRIYTPQLVVDGHLEAVGSDTGAVRRILMSAAKAPKGTIALSTPGEGGTPGTLSIQVRLPETVQRKGDAEVMLAVIEDGLTSRVKRGENGGRTLVHDGVVRQLKSVTRIDSRQRELDLSTTMDFDPDWKTASLRIVAFAQEIESRRILAIGTVRANR